jgi:hypothetical protein
MKSGGQLMTHSTQVQKMADEHMAHTNSHARARACSTYIEARHEDEGVGVGV